MQQQILIALVFGFLSSFMNSTRGQTETTEQSLLSTHLAAARDFTLFTDAARSKALVLEESPVFVWTNPRRMVGGQSGHVFLWKDKEKPLAVCTVYSFGNKGVMTDRQIVYEWHTLWESKIVPVRRSSASEWEPKAGVVFQSIPSGQTPSSIVARQKLEVRQVLSKFEAASLDPTGTRWPLRSLSKPLCSYETDAGAGVLMGWIGDVGTDPEMLLMLEVRLVGNERVWQFAPIRMTDHELFVKFDGNEVWKSVRTPTDTSTHDERHLYFRFRDKVIPMVTTEE